MASADVTTALEAARRAAARWGPSIFDDLLATLGAHGNEHTALGASRAASMCLVAVRAVAACTALAWVTEDWRGRVGGNSSRRPRLPALSRCVAPLSSVCTVATQLTAALSKLPGGAGPALPRCVLKARAVSAGAKTH